MIEEIHKSFAEVYDKGYVNGYKDAKKKFDRPHGEWMTEPHSRIIHCSNCGAEENLNKIHVAKWCYSCGADMREGEADE